MKIIIAGSRDCTLDIFIEKMQLCEFEITEIVSGCAKGVDSFAIQLANEYSIPIKKFPANWDKYGKSAGYIRNIEMAKYSHGLFAIWNGVSKGTHHMINIAKDYFLEIQVEKYEL